MWNVTEKSTAKPACFRQQAHRRTRPIVDALTRCYARPLAVVEEELGHARVEQPIELTAETLWTEVAGRLKGACNDSTVPHVVRRGRRAERSRTTRLSSPFHEDFTREWIEGHFLELIRAAVRDATGQQRRIQLTVAETGAGVPDTHAAAGAADQRVGLNTTSTRSTSS